ncbi:MAG TPA: flagellar assembly protein FliX [Alphaproteobacteria bacterium]|nr:flagellar assembly protein FliX [Alphaproteobacteria bacterium]
MISKIEGPGGIRSSQPVKRTGKTGAASGTSFAKHLDETSEADAAHGVAGTGSISGVLGVQEVDDALAHASKGKLRAQDILDRLEDLRIELLTGGISKEKLIQLARIVSARRAQVTDPRLAEVLDEIDLRAQVELAKHSQQPTT